MNVQEERAAAEALLKALPGVTEFGLIGSAMYMPDDAVGDVDYAVMLADGLCAVDYANALCGDGTGWEACGHYDGVGGTWDSIRRGNLNLIITHDRKFFDGYRLAMEVCKVLRLAAKDDRIAVCRVVRDGFKADEVRPAVMPIDWETACASIG